MPVSLPIARNSLASPRGSEAPCISGSNTHTHGPWGTDRAGPGLTKAGAHGPLYGLCTVVPPFTLGLGLHAVCSQHLLPTDSL